jgi:hypothetical protein
MVNSPSFELDDAGTLHAHFKHSITNQSTVDQCASERQTEQAHGCGSFCSQVSGFEVSENTKRDVQLWKEREEDQAQGASYLHNLEKQGAKAVLHQTPPWSLERSEETIK